MKPFIKRDLFKIKKDSYLHEKTTLFKHLIIQLSIILCMSITCISSVIYYNKTQEAHKKIKSNVKEKISEIDKYITINSYVDKAVNDINEISLDAEGVSSNAFIKNFNELLSHISYYHKIYDPIDSYISNISTSSNISPIHVKLKFKAKKDRRIVRFVDSLLLNLQGFVFLRKIDINKNNGYVDGEVEFEWYTSKKIKKACMEKEYQKIIPRKPQYPVEERCRISIWEGDILPIIQ